MPQMDSVRQPAALNRSRQFGFLSIGVSALIAYYVMWQWFPYAENIYNTNTDWSQVSNAGPEPWDGTLLGMYLITVVGWLLLAAMSVGIGALIQRKTGHKLNVMLYAGTLAIVPILVSVWFASKPIR